VDDKVDEIMDRKRTDERLLRKVEERMIGVREKEERRMVARL